MVAILGQEIADETSGGQGHGHGHVSGHASPHVTPHLNGIAPSAPLGPGELEVIATAATYVPPKRSGSVPVGRGGPNRSLTGTPRLGVVGTANNARSSSVPPREPPVKSVTLPVNGAMDGKGQVNGKSILNASIGRDMLTLR